MTRVLIVGGATRGLRLAAALSGEGHALRIVAGDAECRTAVEATGAQLHIGTPLRPATLRGALEHVTIACWLDGASPESFLLGAVDSSMRGFVYEAHAWERLVLETARRNSIPVAALRTCPCYVGAWLAEARAAVARLISGPRHSTATRYAYTSDIAEN